jgi:hypothetical protein
MDSTFVFLAQSKFIEIIAFIFYCSNHFHFSSCKSPGVSEQFKEKSGQTDMHFELLALYCYLNFSLIKSPGFLLEKCQMEPQINGVLTESWNLI